MEKPERTRVENPSLSTAGGEDERPPILGSWGNLYALVLIVHALLLAFLYAFGRYWS